jgi:hypothetical protein
MMRYTKAVVGVILALVLLSFVGLDLFYALQP